MQLLVEQLVQHGVCVMPCRLLVVSSESCFQLYVPVLSARGAAGPHKSADSGACCAFSATHPATADDFCIWCHLLHSAKQPVWQVIPAVCCAVPMDRRLAPAAAQDVALAAAAVVRSMHVVFVDGVCWCSDLGWSNVDCMTSHVARRAVACCVQPSDLQARWGTLLLSWV